MRSLDEIDWETQRDADVLVSSAELAKDPVRVAKAKKHIRDKMSIMENATKKNYVNSSRYNNPATLAKLKPFN